MRDGETGRFQPGQSGNPGGRPAASPPYRALHGRQAKKALMDFLRLLGPGLSVVLVDARGLQLVDPAEARGLLDPAATLDDLSDAELEAIAGVQAGATDAELKAIVAAAIDEVRATTGTEATPTPEDLPSWP